VVQKCESFPETPPSPVMNTSALSPGKVTIQTSAQANLELRESATCLLTSYMDWAYCPTRGWHLLWAVHFPIPKLSLHL
jgi:hypothetical protein